MKIDRTVITTFPGYFFSTVLCLRSVKKYLSHLPIDIIIDNYDLTHWPTYVDDCQQYLVDEFPDLNLNFVLFSKLSMVDRAKKGGWFRQQLIKLHLDQLVSGENWISVDADVVFNDVPKINTIPVVKALNTPIDQGNRYYVKCMLNIEQPYLDQNGDYLCASGVPFRFLSRGLLTDLRNHVEQVHNKNFLQMHLDLMENDEIVAYDPNGQTMVMSEFQLLEIFRYRLYRQKLPIQVGTSAYDHDSIKDWKRDISWFKSQGISVPVNFWNLSQEFGKHHV